MKTGLIAAIAIVALVGAALLLQGASDNANTPAARQSDLDRFGDLMLTDYRGTPVSLASYRGGPLVVNSWAVWCPFCKQELPDFAALQREFPDIAVIAIDRGESRVVAQGYTDELGISSDLVLLLDPGDDFYRRIGGFSMPETVFIDKAGSIVFHQRGPLTLQEMSSAVRRHFGYE